MLHNLWAYQTHSQSQSQSQHWSQCLSQRQSQSQSRSQSQSIEIEIRLQVAGRTTYGSAAFWHATPRKFRLHLAGQSIHTRTYTNRWAGFHAEVRQHILRVLFMAAAVRFYPTPNPPIAGNGLSLPIRWFSTACVSLHSSIPLSPDPPSFPLCRLLWSSFSRIPRILMASNWFTCANSFFRPALKTELWKFALK